MTDARRAPGASTPVPLGAGVVALLTTVRSLDPRDDEPFNLGLAVGDDAARVRARRRLVSDRLGVLVVFGRQVHGRDVHVVSAPPTGDLDEVAVSDALVTTRDDVALGVLTADCVPVLLVGARGDAPQVVAAAHVGRAGLVAGVVDAVLDAMADAVGGPAENLQVRAVLGPAACGACYEVPADLRDDVAARVPGTATTTRWGTPGLDLPAGVVAQLRSRGVLVPGAGGCTIEDPVWFSHRASGHGRGSAPGRPTGRQAGVVRLRPGASGVSPQQGAAAGLA